MKYSTRIYWSADDDCWFAEHPALKECFSDGDTAREALDNLTIARTLWIESRTAAGLEIPKEDSESRPAASAETTTELQKRIANQRHNTANLQACYDAIRRQMAAFLSQNPELIREALKDTHINEVTFIECLSESEENCKNVRGAYTAMRDALQYLVQSAVTDADTCPICKRDASDHDESCPTQHAIDALVLSEKVTQRPNSSTGCSAAGIPRSRGPSARSKVSAVSRTNDAWTAGSACRIWAK